MSRRLTATGRVPFALRVTFLSPDCGTGGRGLPRTSVPFSNCHNVAVKHNLTEADIREYLPCSKARPEFKTCSKVP